MAPRIYVTAAAVTVLISDTQLLVSVSINIKIYFMLLSISVCESNVIPGVDGCSIFTVIQLKWIFTSLTLLTSTTNSKWSNYWIESSHDCLQCLDAAICMSGNYFVTAQQQLSQLIDWREAWLPTTAVRPLLMQPLIHLENALWLSAVFM